jgi:hypothetical protein
MRKERKVNVKNFDRLDNDLLNVFLENSRRLY